MRIGIPRVEQRGETAERWALVSWAGGELRVGITAPAQELAPAEDSSAFLAAALLAAMRRHEDIEVEGQVSPRFLEACEEIQMHYHAWDLSLRRCHISAQTAEPPPAGAGTGSVGAFMSRGVDSTYSAVAGRAEPLERLVFCRNLDPGHGAQTQEGEVAMARRMSDRVGLPLVTVASNVRQLTEPILNWSDALGTAMAFLALSLSNGFRRLTIPSWADYESLGPSGSHPLTDPLFSTEALEVRHDEIEHGRLGKVAVLAGERPDLLPLLKVCYRVDDTGNCGRCRKCLWTMCCLYAVGALHGASLFPQEIDTDALAARRVPSLAECGTWLEVHRALPEGDPVRAAIATALRRSARPTARQRIRGRLRPPGRLDLLPPPWDNGGPAFYRHATNSAIRVLRDGRPYP